MRLLHPDNRRAIEVGVRRLKFVHVVIEQANAAIAAFAEQAADLTGRVAMVHVEVGATAAWSDRLANSAFAVLFSKHPVVIGVIEDMYAALSKMVQSHFHFVICATKRFASSDMRVIGCVPFPAKPSQELQTSWAFLTAPTLRPASLSGIEFSATWTQSHKGIIP